jgi:hypothetical protein
LSDEPIQAWVLDEGSKGGVERGLRLIDVDPAEVRAGLERLRRLLPDDDDPRDGSLRRWRMDEVTLSLELSAEAGVRLIGTTNIGVTGAIEVTFRREEE